MNQKQQGTILIVDDDNDILNTAQIVLKDHFSKIIIETDPHMILPLIKKNKPDAIFLDMNFTQDASSGREGFYWLEEIQRAAPQISVVFITAYGDVEKAVAALHAGAKDFLLKPWQNEKLIATASTAVALSQSQRQVSQLILKQKQFINDVDSSYDTFIGQSPKIMEVLNKVKKVAKTDAHVLLLGENGTGKGLIAHLIHQSSNRAYEIFSKVDLGSINQSLFESELFGHVKGAFTGATDNRLGRFEFASKGTLFLDEIGNLPLELQSKLLTVIEKKTIIRVGSNEERPVDARLICATNKPLHTMVNNSTFRQDLLYRINTVEIHLPPLRERLEDFPELSTYFLKLHCKKYQKEEKTIHDQAMSELMKYSWPGNLRELNHMIERAVILSDSKTLVSSDFFSPNTQQHEELFDLNQLELCSFNLEDIEKILIKKAMHQSQNNISKTAELLGLSRSSLYRRLEKYDLS